MARVISFNVDRGSTRLRRVVSGVAPETSGVRPGEMNLKSNNRPVSPFRWIRRDTESDPGDAGATHSETILDRRRNAK